MSAFMRWLISDIVLLTVLTIEFVGGREDIKSRPHSPWFSISIFIFNVKLKLNPQKENKLSLFTQIKTFKMISVWVL